MKAVFSRRSWMQLFILSLVLLLTPAISSASQGDAPIVQANAISPDWEISLPSGNVCENNLPCHRASPTLAYVDTDDKLDIVIATNNGHILAVRDANGNGQVIFNVDIAPMFGRPPNSMQIQSSPAVADIDLDGRVEIIVGVGNANPNDGNSIGGMVALEHTGAHKWHFESWGDNPFGQPGTIFSSPAIGNIDGDPQLEVVAGGFDKRIYAVNHNGSMVSGFPADSFHRDRFPTWPQFQGALGDTVWSSPALADMDGDGDLDIVIGTDEGNYDDRWGGDAEGWTCPYEDPPGYPGGYCGGSVYALDGQGNLLPGWPKYVLETVQSTPVLADLNGNGLNDVIVGTGVFYYNNSPSNPTFGFKLMTFNHQGNGVTGNGVSWNTGKALGGLAPASPSIGDITGDGVPEVIIGASDKKIYAFHLDGSLVSGFPMTPRTNGGSTTKFDVGKSFILADYDGDGDNEIYVTQLHGVTIINGNGSQITTENGGNDGKPYYDANDTVYNNIAVGDIDNDGRLEMIVQNQDLYVWELPQSSLTADWPQFKGNAAGTSALETPGQLGDVTNEVTVLHEPGSPNDPVGLLEFSNDGGGDLHWQVTSTPASVDIIGATSGTVSGYGSATVNFSVEADGFGNGSHNLGNIVISTTDDGGNPAGSANISVVLVVGDLHRVYLPVTAKR